MRWRLLLVAANLALIGGIGWVLSAEPAITPATTTAFRIAAEPPLPLIAAAAPIQAGRSFFRVLAPEPVRTGSLPAPPAQPKLRLVGVLLLEGRNVGLVEQEGVTRRLGEGDEVAGWRVAAIQARELTLVQGQRNASYRLDDPAARR